MLTSFSLVFAEKSVQNITVVITLYCIFYRLSIMVSGLGDGQNADPQSMDYPNGLPRRANPSSASN